jgi:hypothetical protein
MQIEKVDGFVVSATCPEGGRYTRVMTASPIPDDILAQTLTFSPSIVRKTFGYFKSSRECSQYVMSFFRPDEAID